MNPRTTTLAATAILFAACLTPRPMPAQAHTPSPCALLSPDQIKVVLGSPVLIGKPGPNDCTWNDAKGETRVYLSLKDATPEYKAFRDSMQATGRLVPVTGLAEDAFFVSATGTSAALYTLKARHLLLLTVNGIGYTKSQNEAAERGLATQILPKL